MTVAVRSQEVLSIDRDQFWSPPSAAVQEIQTYGALDELFAALLEEGDVQVGHAEAVQPLKEPEWQKSLGPSFVAWIVAQNPSHARMAYDVLGFSDEPIHGYRDQFALAVKDRLKDAKILRTVLSPDMTGLLCSGLSPLRHGTLARLLGKRYPTEPGGFLSSSRVPRCFGLYPIALEQDATTSPVQQLTPPEWVGTVLQRIEDSAMKPGEEYVPGTMLTAEIALAARLFFRRHYDLLPSEPIIYATRQGDLACEFETRAGRLTIIISSKFLVAYDEANKKQRYTQINDWAKDELSTHRALGTFINRDHRSPHGAALETSGTGGTKRASWASTIR